MPPAFTPDQLARLTQPEMLAALPQLFAENQASDAAIGERLTVLEGTVEEVQSSSGGASNGPDVTLLFVGYHSYEDLTVTITDGAGSIGVVTLINNAGYDAPVRTGAGAVTTDIGGGLGDDRAILAALIAHSVLALVAASDLAVSVEVVVAAPAVSAASINVSAAGVSLRITDTSGQGPATAARSAGLAGAIEVA